MHLKRPEDVAQLVKIQRQILENAARALKPLDKGQPDQVGAIVARDLAARLLSGPRAESSAA